MSVSDFILAILALIGFACVTWVLDLNPYSKRLQVYNQTCDNMILDKTYCKGDWLDNPVETFVVNQDSGQIISKLVNQSEPDIYQNCTIKDRKNWVCMDESTQQNITVKDGLIIYSDNSNTRQITRLQWLQNIILKIIT